MNYIIFNNMRCCPRIKTNIISVPIIPVSKRVLKILNNRFNKRILELYFVHVKRLETFNLYIIENAFTQRLTKGYYIKQNYQYYYY